MTLLAITKKIIFKKIATCDKIKFPQQANSMVGTEGVPAEIAPMTFFLQIKPKIILILIQLRQKKQNLIF